MIDLTPDAKVRFEQYLQRLRGSLRGTRAVEADEVEQNVREHVEIALAGAPSPVGAASLADVLEQLGPPEQWLSDEERPAWRRAMDRLIQGSEDWRLPYLSIGLVSRPTRGIACSRRWLVLSPTVIVFAARSGALVFGEGRR